MSKEFCIIPPNPMYSTVRTPMLHRHEKEMSVEEMSNFLNVFYCKCMVHQGGNRFEKFVFGKKVFLTKEEAEEKLKELNKNGTSKIR